MAANKINSVMGIVNGTTNYMLSKMSNEHLDYDEVLKEAQEKGYAESDPTADVGGLDAARKIVILASIAFNMRISLDDVLVEGIENIDACDIKYAQSLGYAIKLLAIAAAFGAQNVSLRNVIQINTMPGEKAEIVVITHSVSESNLKMAMQILEALPVVEKIGCVIRVEDSSLD